MAQVFPKQKALVLALRNMDRVLNLNIPNTVVMSDTKVAVKHGIVEFILLRNSGFNLEGQEPYNYYYDPPKWQGKFTPMAHQDYTSRLLTTYNRCFVCNETRTGKTASSLWAADFLLSEGTVKRVVIFCTISCLEEVWGDAIGSTFWDRSHSVVYGTKAERLKAANADVDFYIFNHDAVKLDYMYKRLCELIDSDCLVIVDEGLAFATTQGKTSARHNSANRLFSKVDWLWWLTATPMTRGPMGVYGMVKIVKSSNMPYNKSTWKELTMTQVSEYKWVSKKEAQELCYKAMQPMILVRKADVMDLPPITSDFRKCEVSPDQKRILTTLRKENGFKYQEHLVIAANGADALQKSIQIAGGAVYKKEGDVRESIRIGAPARIAALKELIDLSESKVLVFASFSNVLDYVMEELVEYDPILVDGRITGTKRTERIRAFKNGDQHKVLVAHPQPIGHGLELAVADTIIFYTPAPDCEIYAQAIQRIQSMQQENNMGVYHLYTEAYEKFRYEQHMKGIDAQRETLELYYKE